MNELDDTTTENGRSNYSSSELSNDPKRSIEYSAKDLSAIRKEISIAYDQLKKWRKLVGFSNKKHEKKIPRFE